MQNLTYCTYQYIFYSICFRYRPVWLFFSAATSSGRPAAMTSPPLWPPSGPRSTIQSAVLKTSRLCSITTEAIGGHINQSLFNSLQKLIAFIFFHWSQPSFLNAQLLHQTEIRPCDKHTRPPAIVIYPLRFFDAIRQI